MPKLPALKPREVERILLDAGFTRRITKSAHVVYRNLKTRKYTTVSFHQKDIPMGTLHAIIRQSGMTVDEFHSLRKKKK